MKRRELLQWGAATVAGVWAGEAFSPLARAAKTQKPRELPGEPALAQFGYGQVELDPSPLQRQFEENHQLLLQMNEDDMLRPYRVREGLPAPGTDLGGWYDTYAFAPGFTYPQWISALARFYAATGDQATCAKVNRMVRGYAATIDPAGKFFDNNRFPAYSYDKLVLAMIDAHKLAHDPVALDAMRRTTDAALSHLPERAMPHRDTPVHNNEDFTEHCWDESYTLGESQFMAWELTGEARYLELAKRFLPDHDYFDPLARGENVLPGQHAYSHVNALSSAAAAYIALGDEKYLRAAKNGLDMVHQQSFATGGWGPDEHFVVPGSGQLGASLESVHSSFETPCGSWAHFKITRYLTRITRDSRYGDSMERVMYNTVLGATPVQPDGHTFYYSDYTFDATKFFHPDKWPCCSGTLPEVAADYRVNAYFQDQHGIYVNLYVPSKVTWSEGGVRHSLRQITEYPYDSKIQLELSASSPATFSVFLRIPEWAQGATLSVNGNRDSQQLAAGAFAEVRREWKTGNRIELELPLLMRLETVDAQHPDTVALASGPLVLMAVRDGAEKNVTRASLLAAQKSSPNLHLWTAKSQSGLLQLKPFMDIRDEKYAAYLKVPKV